MRFSLKKMVRVLTILSSLTVYSFSEPFINQSGQVGLIQSSSAQTLGRTRLVFNLSSDFTYDPGYISLLLDRVSMEDQTLVEVITDAGMLNLVTSASFGITSFFDASVLMPVHFDLMSSYPPVAGLGDIEFDLKLRIPGDKPRVFHGALQTALSFPSGTRYTGYFIRHLNYYNESPVDSTGLRIINGVPDSLVNGSVVSCFTSSKFETEFLGLISLNFKWLLLHLNSGVRLVFDKNIDNLFIMAAALELRPSSNFAFFTELRSDTRFSNMKNGFTLLNDHFRINPGIALTAFNGMNMTLAGSFKLSSNKEISYRDVENSAKRFTTKLEPSWKVAFHLGWSGLLVQPDRDKDQIPDISDACPDDPEDIDGFQDNDGCPDLDNDHDAIADAMDKCPNEAEDMDDFEDDDGCPDPDNDNDGILDIYDKCPNEKEDFDGYNDHDGCPDYDNDNDNVPDSLDKCPLVPEDIDGFEDDDGCPDVDNDMDGILDNADRCPDVPGVAEEFGCPQRKPPAKEIKRGRVILRGISFSGGNWALNAETKIILDDVYESMLAFPDIKIEIQAHTDNSLSRESSAQLCEKRAKACSDYLIEKGIPSYRLRATGIGSAMPIADNNSVHGRQLNNRIELHRFD
ncbi:MAG: OmpA family protein [Fibrobacter sp.]|nr:OmpA family protein [Fibrobacter sp.]